MENIFIKEVTNFVPSAENKESKFTQQLDLMKLKPLTLKFSIILKERMIMQQKVPSPSVLEVLNILNERVKKLHDIFVANFETRPRNFTNIVSIRMIKGDYHKRFYRTIYEDYNILKHYGGIFVVHEPLFDTSYVPRLFDHQRYNRLKKLTERDKCYIMYLSVLRPFFAKHNRLLLKIEFGD